MFISVVLSFYNEEDVLPELISRLRNTLKEKFFNNYELIFVNDASTDNSLEILKKFSKGNNDIKIINMSRNFGVSECCLCGMKYAIGKAVIYMDADLQDPPELIPTLIEEWQKDDDIEVVYTTRTSRDGENSIKMLITKFGYKILRSFSNIKLPDNSGDFKLLSRRAVDELLRLNEKKPFLRGLVTWIGFKQAQVFYKREKRFTGKTKFPIYSRRVIDNFLDSALISFSDIPLKLSLVLGFMVSISSFIFLLIVFFQKFIGLAIPGWSGIMATMLVLGGMQLFTMGILGLYINAIYLESKKRPNYIVKDTFGF